MLCHYPHGLEERKIFITRSMERGIERFKTRFFLPYYVFLQSSLSIRSRKNTSLHPKPKLAQNFNVKRFFERSREAMKKKKIKEDKEKKKKKKRSTKRNGGRGNDRLKRIPRLFLAVARSMDDRRDELRRQKSSAHHHEHPCVGMMSFDPDTCSERVPVFEMPSRHSTREKTRSLERCMTLHTPS